MSPELGRIILVIGIVLVVIGGLAVLGVRLPFGKLPGDIAIEGENGGIYIPLEIYELSRGLNWYKVAALVINIAIVAFMAWMLLDERRERVARRAGFEK